MLGLGFRFPTGWVLPDTTANLLGGAIGAIASVAGAFLVLRRQMRYEAQRAADARIAAKDADAARLLELRKAVANALFTDTLAAIVLLKKSAEIWEQETRSAIARRSWLQRLELTPMPGFDALKDILPTLGDGLAPVVIHAYGEVLRFRAIVNGFLLTNDLTTGEARDFMAILAEQIPVTIRNLAQAKRALEPFTHFEVPQA